MNAEAKQECEGCGELLVPSWAYRHKGKCKLYIEWSKSLPLICRKGCGRGFPENWSRSNHERTCGKHFPNPGKICGLCKGRYFVTHSKHLKSCTGPDPVPELPSPIPEFDKKLGCLCGYEGPSGSATLFHRKSCGLWWAYREKGATLECEGCHRKFLNQTSKNRHSTSCEDWKVWKEAKDEEEKVFPCPSCGEKMRSNILGAHPDSCAGGWKKEDWERYWEENAEQRKRAARIRRRGGKELSGLDNSLRGEEFVVCAICDDRFVNLSGHLSCTHGISVEEYKAKYGRRARAACVKKKSRKTMMDRYGAPTSVQAGLMPNSMTGPEIKVNSMGIKGLVFTGDHKYWVSVVDSEGNRKPRNPDFVVYTPEQMTRIASGEPVGEVRSKKFVEVLGDYWHGPRMQSMSNEEYVESRRIEYESAGIRCLFVWEGEVNKDPESVRSRIQEFIDS